MGHARILHSHARIECGYHLRRPKQRLDIFTNTHRIGNIGILANFLFRYICSFLLYFHIMMLVNVKLDINWHKRITFQGCKLHWSS